MRKKSRKKAKKKKRKKFSSCQMLFVLSKHQRGHDDERCATRLTFFLPFIVLFGWIQADSLHNVKVAVEDWNGKIENSWRCRWISMIVCARLRKWKKVVNPPPSSQRRSICGVKKGFFPGVKQVRDLPTVVFLFAANSSPLFPLRLRHERKKVSFWWLFTSQKAFRIPFFLLLHLWGNEKKGEISIGRKSF